MALSTNGSRRIAETSGVAVSLARCLTLVAPVGMCEDDRAEWLGIAIDALAGEIELVGEAKFVLACRHAMMTCQHHSEIVPTIYGELHLKEEYPNGIF